MPLVAHNALPTFDRLRAKGQTILSEQAARHQDIREQHIGLLNMMPDAALEATERQFYRLIGESNPIAQFYVHPFTLPELDRGEQAAAHIEKYYESFDDIQSGGLDALIITGANVVGPDLSSQVFWEPLIKVIDWAEQHVTSTLCSCLATHAVLEFRYGQKRIPQPRKTWGVFPHRVVNKKHPIVNDINTRFDVPHSRWNKVTPEQFDRAGLNILVESDIGVHLATSEDGIRFVFFQGHQEYDTVSLLKEYKRDLLQYARGKLSSAPPYPENYLGARAKAILGEYKLKLLSAANRGEALPEFPEQQILPKLDNTWHDTAESVVGNWLGCIYQVTNSDRNKPFMDGIDINDPLGIKHGK
jgi:homoserine O-succinyltransferase